MTYTLDLCTNFAKRGMVRSWQFAGIVRANAPGEFRVEFPTAAALLEENATVTEIDSVVLWDESVSPARIVFGGIVQPVGSSSVGVKRQIGPEGETVTINGVDVFGVLNSRVTFPDPSESPSAWPALGASHDERVGVGSNVAAGYISANIGATALPGRRASDTPGVSVSIVDPGVGSTVDWASRLEPLGQVVGRICRASGMVCRASMPAAGVLRYTFTSGTDRSAVKVITGHDDAVELSVLSAPSSGTYVLAGGQGTGSARAILTSEDGSVGVDRVETFYDVANLLEKTTIQLAANGERLRRAAADSVSVTGDYLSCRWPDDYDVGDTLGIRVADVRTSAQVQGVTLQVTPTRSTVLPVFGQEANDEVTAIMRQVFGTAATLNRTVV